MSSLWTDLLFLHGYIRDHRLARRLTSAGKATPHAGKPDADHRRRQADRRNGVPRSWMARLCLGIGDGDLRTQ